MTTFSLQHWAVPAHVNVVVPFQQINNSDCLMLPIAGAAELKCAESLVATISGTSASGDNVHLLLDHSLSTNCHLLPQMHIQIESHQQEPTSKCVPITTSFIFCCMQIPSTCTPGWFSMHCLTAKTFCSPKDLSVFLSFLPSTLSL